MKTISKRRAERAAEKNATISIWSMFEIVSPYNFNIEIVHRAYKKIIFRAKGIVAYPIPPLGEGGVSESILF